MFFFFHDTPTTEIYTLSLHDALPILLPQNFVVDDGDGIRDPIGMSGVRLEVEVHVVTAAVTSDRKSTRLNSSHGYISYAVFCLKKKKKKIKDMNGESKYNRLTTSYRH